MASRSRISRRNRESMGCILTRSEENTRLRYGDTAIPDTKPSPRGEGGERSEPDRVLAV